MLLEYKALSKLCECKYYNIELFNFFIIKEFNLYIKYLCKSKLMYLFTV